MFYVFSFRKIFFCISSVVFSCLVEVEFQIDLTNTNQLKIKVKKLLL